MIDGSDSIGWYEKRFLAMLIAFLFLLIQSISTLIPPQQSPDEEAHLKRAYFLSAGHIFAINQGSSTGGYVDSGLLEYLSAFYPLMSHSDRRLSEQELSNSRNIQWSHSTQFAEFTNTAYYFPFIYTPQALAMLIGRNVGLTVSSSYYLARLFSLVATLGLLWVALSIYPAPLFLLAVFAMPMTLFQMGSASLDSMSYGLSVLAASFYMRGADTQRSFGSGMHLGLCLAIFLLTTSRDNLIPLAILPAFLYRIRGSRWLLLSSSTLFVSSLAWIAYTLTTITDASATCDRSTSTSFVARYYLTHVLSLFQVLYDTARNSQLMTFYWDSFIGILGWLDTPLNRSVYAGFGILFLVLAGFCLQLGTPIHSERGRLPLLCCGTASLLLLFPIFILACSPFPPTVITGIQGRYFIAPFIFIIFAIFNRPLSLLQQKIGVMIVFLMLILSVANMCPILLSRYWMTNAIHVDLIVLSS